MNKVDLVNNPAYQLWQTTNAWQRSVRRALEPLGLTHVQFVVLASLESLSDDEKMVSQVVLCRRAAIDPNMTSDVLKLLERKLLIQRLRHPTDRRAYCIVFTPEGQNVLAEARAVVKPVSDAFFQPLGEELGELTRMLAVLVSHAPCRAGDEPS
jgi:DNA-binding MarR family transcriptional regulator